MGDDEFIQEAMRRAEEKGLYRAAEQRPVDWDEVKVWADRCQQPGFQWSFNSDEIIVSRNGAVCDGQHRVLGGLMGGNPPPFTRQNFDNPTQPWNRDEPYDVLDILQWGDR